MAALGGGGDVVEDEFVGAFGGVARGQRQDVADGFVVAELHAFDDLAVADVQAGDYAFGQHVSASFRVMRPSSRARPVMMPLTPLPLRARMWSRLPMPPEAWMLSSG